MKKNFKISLMVVSIFMPVLSLASEDFTNLRQCLNLQYEYLWNYDRPSADDAKPVLIPVLLKGDGQMNDSRYSSKDEVFLAVDKSFARLIITKGKNSSSASNDVYSLGTCVTPSEKNHHFVSKTTFNNHKHAVKSQEDHLVPCDKLMEGQKNIDLDQKSVVNFAGHPLTEKQINKVKRRFEVLRSEIEMNTEKTLNNRGKVTWKSFRRSDAEQKEKRTEYQAHLKKQIKDLELYCKTSLGAGIKSRADVLKGLIKQELSLVSSSSSSKAEESLDSNQ